MTITRRGLALSTLALPLLAAVPAFAGVEEEGVAEKVEAFRKAMIDPVASMRAEAVQQELLSFERLLSDLSTGVTGEIHFVDCGYNVIAMPHPEALRADRERGGD